MKWQILRMTLIVIWIAFLSILPMATAIAGPSNFHDNALLSNQRFSPSTTTLPENSRLERIQFAPGTTSAVVSGELATTNRARYVLRAFAGQLMDVDLSAPEGVELSVTTADGGLLVPITSSSTSFRGYLPINGDYVITISSHSLPVPYSFNIKIPQRISFEWSTTSATLTGHLKSSQSHDYILRAKGGQIMEVDVLPDDPEKSLQLIFYGVDGTVLRSGMGEGSSFRGELPASEDFIVAVRGGEEDASYIISVIIPQRITFQRGAISASVAGRMSAYQSQYYILRALKNQMMQVNVPASDDVQLIVYGADGEVLKSGMGEGANFKSELPSTQDYILVVRTGSNSVWYTLQVTIR
jgi:hypothetical protein